MTADTVVSDYGENLFDPSKRLTYQVKRCLEVVFAVFAIVLFAPMLTLIAAVVSLDGGPILYLGNRVGKGGRIFKCLKFRTMIPAADACLDEYLCHNESAKKEWLRDQKLAFDPRVTFVGSFLRKTSLDEVPQLLNVIKGEMSLVGPRPVSKPELDLHYGPDAAIYCRVLPGITGLWQVSGRSDVDYATRVTLDVQYVQDWRIATDLIILFKTPFVVISRRGAR
jgi:exopolysaccharide production protein ExoY